MLHTNSTVNLGNIYTTINPKIIPFLTTVIPMNSKFMAETLFDENFGGKQGNFHIALGASYPDTYAGDISTMTKEKKESLGYNDSVDHTDMISTQKRTVTVVLKNGKTRVIYKDGQFTI